MSLTLSYIFIAQTSELHKSGCFTVARSICEIIKIWINERVFSGLLITKKTNLKDLSIRFCQTVKIVMVEYDVIA